MLYIVNRPGNVPSHKGAAEWIERAMDLVAPHAKKICLRGDTDFSLTRNFDRWAERVDFVFGMDAYAGLVKRADGLPEADWKVLKRKPKYEVQTQERLKPENIKEQIVRERAYRNIKLSSEDVAEFEYRPARCKQTYRMVVVRKNLSVEKGEEVSL